MRWRGLTSGLLALFLIAATTVLPEPLRPQAVAGERSSAGQDRSVFRDPPASLRPKLRWSWPATAVKDRELRFEVREMASAGIGGAEIISLGVLPTEGNPPETCKWGTDFMADRYRTALRVGRKDGVGIDFTIGPSWPWGSPAVSGKHLHLSQPELLDEQQVVVGPSSFEGPPPRPSDLDEEHGKLVAVTAAQPEHDLTQASSDQEGVLLDPKSTVDLTPEVDKQGQLHWEVPPGEWILFGFWRQPIAQAANASSFAGCDWARIVDHMRRESARAALKFLDEHLLDKLGRARANLHEVFEESLELQVHTLWTPDFLKEFRARRGYDLTRYLPVLIPSLPGPGSTYFTPFTFVDCPFNPEPYDNCRVPHRYDFAGNAGERVRRDYNQTATDLYIEEHVLPTTRWARRHGLAHRLQAYGDFGRNGSFENIGVAKAAGVPEAEDLYSNTIDFWRTIASGAHLSGARKVSLEHGVVFFRDWMMTLRGLKFRADKAFVGGVNQLVTYGYPYRRANGDGWPTWCPLSSEHIGIAVSDCWNGTNPQWPHLRPLADYFARAQTVLRAGRPVSDVAIYRDVYGYPQRAATWNEEDGDFGQRTDGSSTEFCLSPTVRSCHVQHPEPPLNTSLSRAGLNFDFVNPATLAEQGTRIKGRRLVVQRPGYKALVVDLDSSKRLSAVDNSRAMAGPVAERLVAFARAGLPIVFVGRFPERGVSYSAPEKEDAAVQAAVAQLKKSPRVRLVEDESEVAAALSELGVKPDLAFEEPQDVYSVHRETKRGDYWFLWNAGAEPARFTGSFRAGRRAPEAWDLWTGAVRPVGLYRTAGARVEVPIELAPLESVVIGFEKSPRLHVVKTDSDDVIVKHGKLLLRSTTGGTARATLSDGTKKEVRFGTLPDPVEPAEWDLHVDGAVPEGKERHDLTLTELRDWREIPELKDTSGVGTYKTTVTLDDEWIKGGRGAYLELGRVEGGIQVRVNGRLVSPASVPLPRFDIGPFLRTGENTIEVELTTTLKNRLNSMATQEGYRRFLFRPEKTQPYGLIGPVQLVPYAERVLLHVR